MLLLLIVLIIFTQIFIQPVFAEDATSSATQTTVSDFNSGVSSNTEVTDVGSGDGSVTNALSVETIDQQQTTGSTKEDFDNGEGQWLAQTFTATSSGLLSKVSLSLDRNNSSNSDGNVSLEVRTSSSGSPTSTILATTATSSATLNQNGQEDRDFQFSSPATIDSGQTYALVVYRAGSGTITTNYNWYRASATGSNNPYTQGSGFTSSNSGSSWSLRNSGNGDQRFTTYLKSYATTGIQASDVFDSDGSSNFTSLAWSETLPSNTNITFEVRSSSNSFTKTDNSLSWNSLGTSNSPVDLTNVLATSRYFQWRATLSGTFSSTPTLKDVTINYTRLASGDTNSSGSAAGAPICTDTKPDSAPTLLSAQVLGENQIKLTWSKAADPVSYYLITYGSAPGLQQYGNPNVGGSDTTSFIIQGLSSDTTYYFKVRAGNGCAPGDFSNELSVKPAGKIITSPAEGFIAGVLGTVSETVEIKETIDAGSIPVGQKNTKPPSTASNLFVVLANFLQNLLNRLKDFF